MRKAFVLFWLAVASLGGQIAQANGASFWVEAEGLAFISSPADRDAARRRALGEALISAALAGGASLQGHTVLHNARITSDVAILRPVGRVLRHDVLFAREEAGHWRVRVKALVGKAELSQCSGRRRFIVDAAPPDIRVSPQTAAWSAQVAKTLASDLIEVFRESPAIVIESLEAPSTRRVPAILDYTTLTRGPSRANPANDRLDLRIALDGQGAEVRLSVSLTLTDTRGRGIRRTFKRNARSSSDGLTALATMARRSQAEARLVDNLVEDVRAYVEDLACKPLESRLVQQSGGLTVDIGRRNGLSRSSLAFVDDPGDSFALLEVIELGERSARLRPLDPTRSLSSFAGRRVYFLEARL